MSALEINIRTFFTIVAFITSIADAGTHNADAMSSTVDVDALVGWHVTLSPFPPAVALAAATRVLAITTAQHWTGSWTRHKREDEAVIDSVRHLNPLSQSLQCLFKQQISHKKTIFLPI